MHTFNEWLIAASIILTSYFFTAYELSPSKDEARLVAGCKSMNEETLLVLMESPELNADHDVTVLLNNCFAVKFKSGKKHP